MISPCRKTEPGKMETNRDLLMYLFAIEYDLDVCAAKVDAVRIFYETEAE